MAAPASESVTRQVAVQLPAGILSYVARTVGPDGMRQLAELLDDPTGPGLDSPQHWRTGADVARLHAAAACICRDAEIGRRSGEEIFWEMVPLLGDFWLSTGSPEQALVLVAEHNTRFKHFRPLTVSSMGRNHVVIEGRYDDRHFAHRSACEFNLGFSTMIPTIFGQVGTGIETMCQLDGADHCEFRIAWVPSPIGSAVPAAGDSVSRLSQNVDRFVDLQRIASELVGAGDVDGVMDVVAKHVNSAVLATYILCVQLPGGGALKVRHEGLSADEVAVATARLMAGELARVKEIVTVPVVFKGRVYGQLAVFFPPGTPILDADQRMLTAFAQHAAAALEVIASLDQARKDRDLAKALLGLARGLAEVGTVEDIANRLAAAVPVVVRCESAAVYVYDELAEVLRLRGTSDRPASGRQPPAAIGVDMLPNLQQLIRHPAPIILRSGDVTGPAASGFTGLEMAAFAPIVSKGRFHGAVAAGFVTSPEAGAQAEMIERLSGLADHAATALENARLLEQMQHDTLHDSLTGLPNRLLAEDRTAQAFAVSARSSTQVGLLFVDLDRFKDVNDTLGHTAGDDLICQVANRMLGVMRGTDTLARVGGDEFVVVLSELDGVDTAVRVAQRLIHLFDAPFFVAGRKLFISCSVGVGCSPEHGSSYNELQQHSDLAMYSAKASGRGTFAVSSEPFASAGQQPSP